MVIKDNGFFRDFTEYEEKVQFKELNKTFDTYEEAFIKEVGPIQKRQIQTLLVDIEKILKQDRQEDLAQIRVKFHEEHVRAIKSILGKTATDAVNITEKEFDKDKRVTVPRSLRVQNSVRAETLASTFESRIKTSAVSSVLRGLKSNQSTREIMFELRNPTNG